MWYNWNANADLSEQLADSSNVLAHYDHRCTIYDYADKIIQSCIIAAKDGTWQCSEFQSFW